MINLDIIKSIISIKFYRKIYDQSFKKSFFYVLLISLLIYFVGAFANVMKIDTMIKNEGTFWVNSLPKFSIKDGKLSTNSEKPYSLIIGSKGIIIDTLNSADLSKYKDVNWFVILRESEIAAGKENYLQTVSYDWILSKIKMSSIDKDYLLNIIPILSMIVRKYVIWFYVIGFLFWLLFYKSISVLLLSGIGSIINSLQKANLNYSQLLNISIYAITLPWIVKLIYKLLDVNFRLSSVIYVAVYWIIAITYFCFVVKDIKANVLKKADTSNVEEATAFDDIILPSK